GEGELMAHDVPLGCAPDEYDDLISGTCSHLPYMWMFATSLDDAPQLLEKFSQLRDIGKRVSTDDETSLSGKPC
ncbi:hypothetical protein, partial [Klebsiella pneumoniae]